MSVTASTAATLKERPTIPARAPLVLIVSEHEWASRSLDTVLAPRGYAVVRAYNARQGLARARAADPDLVFIDRTLPDGRGIDLCQDLLAQQAISPATALILTSAGAMTRDQRVEAMRSGAWEVMSLPADAEELVLRADKYVRAKLVMDRAREEALVDAGTGLYTREGLSRRIRELGAAAERFGRPLAFVVLSADESSTEPAQISRLADDLRELTRKSDVLGRIGPSAFVVIAPDTPAEGARNLAERLRQRTSAPAPATTSGTRVTVHALENLGDAAIEPLELLSRLARSGEASGAPELN